MPTLILAAALAAIVPTVPTPATEATQATAPLAPLDALVGAWTATQPSFSTTLTYRWLVEGRVLEVVNDVLATDGRVIARYRGIYAWDAGRSEIVVFTASHAGEIHRGRVWWADGVLWHEATVSGGRLTHYASAVRPGDGRLEYFADYAAERAVPSLLQTDPIVYTKAQ